RKKFLSSRRNQTLPFLRASQGWICTLGAIGTDLIQHQSHPRAKCSGYLLLQVQDASWNIQCCFRGPLDSQAILSRCQKSDGSFQRPDPWKFYHSADPEFVVPPRPDRELPWKIGRRSPSDLFSRICRCSKISGTLT